MSRPILRSWQRCLKEESSYSRIALVIRLSLNVQWVLTVYPSPLMALWPSTRSTIEPWLAYCPIMASALLTVLRQLDVRQLTSNACRQMTVRHSKNNWPFSLEFNCEAAKWNRTTISSVTQFVYWILEYWRRSHQLVHLEPRKSRITNLLHRPIIPLTTLVWLIWSNCEEIKSEFISGFHLIRLICRKIHFPGVRIHCSTLLRNNLYIHPDYWPLFIGSLASMTSVRIIPFCLYS